MVTGFMQSAPFFHLTPTQSSAQAGTKVLTGFPKRHCRRCRSGCLQPAIPKLCSSCYSAPLVSPFHQRLGVAFPASPAVCVLLSFTTY